MKGELARQHYDRLSRAREERERVREITERGYSQQRREESANTRHQQSVASNAGAAKKPLRPGTAAVHKKVPSSAAPSGPKK